MSNTNTYMGPGTNILPAIQYLRKKGATSEKNAVSLDDIQSEDFKQLLKLNGQTSMWIGVTPEGKYWVRSSYMIVIVLIIFIFLGMILLIAAFSTSIFSQFGDIQQRIQEAQQQLGR